jgi:flagellin-specific chaperone FliS
MANVTKNVGELDEIIPLISDIKEAWEKIEMENMPRTEEKAIKPEPVSMFSAEV